MYKNHIEMLVCIDGKPVREHRKDGLVYIEARKGSSYSIKLKNNFNRRALAILSVDGIEVLKGKKAETAEGGYVIEPYSAIDIKGYRISDTEVATFVFGSGYNSYSTYRGQEAGELKPGESSPNNGVIGLRVILEKYTEPNWNVHQRKAYEPFQTTSFNYNAPSRQDATLYVTGCLMTPPMSGCYSTSSSRGMSISTSASRAQTFCYDENPTVNFACAQPDMSSIPEFEVGTEWGDKKEDRIRKVDFVMSEEVFEMALYYTSREALIRAGIDLSSTKAVAGLPKAFGEKYCPAPKGYK